MPSRQDEDKLSLKSQHIRAALGEVDHVVLTEKASVEAVLRRINETSVGAVPGARHAAVTVIDDDRKVTTLAPTAPIAGVLDEVQRETGEGPCLSAAWTQHTILVEDMAAETRWPRYCSQALERTPIRSVLSYRLHEEGRGIAALNFYAETAGAFDDESIEVGLVFAAHTTMAWNMLRREQQFRSALASRDVIGQAKGMLMERFDINAVAAFELLRKLSQGSNTKIVDIAEQLVALGSDNCAGRNGNSSAT